jgi:hypothetical protein
MQTDVPDRKRTRSGTVYGLLSHRSGFGFVPLHPAMNFDAYSNQLHEHLWILYSKTQRSLGAFRPHFQNILFAHWCCVVCWLGVGDLRLLKPKCQNLQVYVRRKRTSRKNFPVFPVASLTFSERQYFREWSKIPEFAFCNGADWL